MSCWQHSSKRRVGSLRKYLVVVCWFPFKGHRTADVCAGRYSLKSDKPDKRNTIKTFSYASVFQATLVLFTRIRTGVLLWRDNLVCIVFTWLLPFVINFDMVSAFSGIFSRIMFTNSCLRNLHLQERIHFHLQYFRLPPPCSWGVHSSGMFRCVTYQKSQGFS